MLNSFSKEGEVEAALTEGLPLYLRRREEISGRRAEKKGKDIRPDLTKEEKRDY